MNISKPKHFYCAVCEKRLDKVPRWNYVTTIESILKLNNLKEGIKSGDRICITCNTKARKIEKKIENSVFQKDVDVDTNEIQNDETSVQMQLDSNVEMQKDFKDTSIQNQNGVETQSEDHSEEEEEFSTDEDTNINQAGSLSKDAIFVDTNYTEKKCVICNKKRGKKNNKLRRINDQLITNTYVKTSVLIPFGSRACTSHFDEYGNFKRSCIGKSY
jgi:hypothetical protein